MRSRFMLTALLCLILPMTLWAQQETGSIAGIVTSSEGETLPGVTISATGKYLFGERTAVTDENGRFRLRKLPVGAYTVNFVMPGFKTVKLTGVTVSLGQTNNRNVTMDVSKLQEVITVTSTQPLVDSSTLNPGDNFDAESLNALPTTKDPWSVLEITPSVYLSQQNVGGNKQGTQARFGAHGTSPYQNAYYVDGINLTDTSASGASGQYYDYDTFEAVQVSTAGHDASVGAPGVNITMVTKSGSNEFEAKASYGISNESMQSDNSFTREDGSVIGSPQDFNREYNLNFRGPIVKDKLWFFVAYHENEVSLYSPNTDKDPAGIDLTTLEQINANLKWAVSETNTVKLTYNENEKAKSNRAPTWPSSAFYQGIGPNGEGLGWAQQGPGDSWSIQDEWFVNDALSFTFKYGEQSFPFSLAPHGAAPDDILTRYPATVNYNSVEASSPYNFPIYDRNNETFTAKGNWFQTIGATSHDVSFGYDLLMSENFTQNRYPADGIVREYDGSLFNATTGDVWFFRPVVSTNETESTSIYVNDVITFDKWTINVGMRYQNQTGSIQAGNIPATWQNMPEELGVIDGVTFRERFGAVTSDAINDAAEWSNFLPRLTVTYDLNADGRTLLKAGYNQYANTMNTSEFSMASPLAEYNEIYRWYDQDGNGRFLGDGSDYNEIAFDELLGRSASGSGTRIADDYDAPVTEELILNVSHQFAGNLAVSASLISRVSSDLTYTFVEGVVGAENWVANDALQADNSDATYSGWEYVGGGQTGGFRGNLRDYETDYTGIELTAAQRGKGYSWNFSFSTGSLDLEYDRFELNDPNTPEVLGSGIGSSNVYAGEYTARFYGAIDLPWQLQLSGKLRYDSGRYFNAFENVSNGYQSFSQLINGRETDSLPSYMIADLGVGRTFKMGSAGNLEVKLDIYNLFNDDTQVSLATANITSANFNAVSEILGPRVARLNVSYIY